jgi:hypothetical protein
MAIIQGKWKWNDTCTYSKLFSVYGEMNFASNEEEYTSLGVESDVFWGGEPQLCYRVYYKKHNGESVNAACFLENGEVVLEHDSFEIEEQEIDDELYAFIIANATDITPLTMAEKLIKIAENEQKVYDKGKAEGYQEGLVSSEAYEKGKQAEYDAFWGAFQTAQRTDWTYAFMGESWNDITFRPKYDLVLSGSSKQVFMNCKITDLEKILGECGVTLDTSGATALNQLFQGSTVTAIPTIDCTSCSIAGINYMFNKCTSLKTIRKLIVDSAINPATNPFTGCSALEYIRFEGDINWALKLGDSPKLTRESIENIIGHLYSGASNKTLTLSETAVNAAFGDEWDSYVTAHKPSGWNITLA